MKQKPLSELLGTLVADVHEQKTLGHIRGATIDPENGKVIALTLGKHRVVATIDIIGFDGQVLVQDEHAIAAPAEVLRLAQIEKSGIRFVGAKVWTERRDFLGTVRDVLINLDTYTVEKLDVAKKWLVWRREERLIPWTAILRVTKEGITVRDAAEGALKQKEEKVGFVAEPA